MHVAMIGADLMTESRIRAVAERAGATVSSHEGPPLPPGADLVIVDLEAVPPGSFDAPGARVIGVYPHVATDLAARARAAGIEPVPRSRFFRELHDLFTSGPLEDR